MRNFAVLILSCWLATAAAMPPEQKLDAIAAHLDKARALMEEQGDLDGAAAALEAAGKAVIACSNDYPCQRTERFAALEADFRARKKQHARGGVSAEKHKRAQARKQAAKRSAQDAETDLKNVLRGKYWLSNQVYGGKAYAPNDAQRALDYSRRIDKDALEIKRAMGDYAAAADDPEASSTYREAQELIGFVEASHKATLEALHENYTRKLDGIDGFSGKAKERRMADLTRAVAIAAQIDGSYEPLKTLNASMAERKAAMIEAQQAKIDAATWPARAKAFNGPGDAVALERAALETLRKDKAWGRNKKRPQEVLATVIQGPWKAAEHDAFGRVISWRLPMKVAITDEKLKPKGLAQVFDISMVTVQGAGGQVDKAPPFDGAWVGDNYYMKRDRLP